MDEKCSLRLTSDVRFVFAHDARFIRRGSDVYAWGPFGCDVWGRFLKYCVQLTVVVRRLPESLREQAQTFSSAERVEFRLCNSISGIHARYRNIVLAKQIVANAVADADGVIARLPSEYGLLAAAEAERAGKPWLIEMAGCPWDGLWNYGGWQGKVYAPVMAVRTRRAVARAPFVTYVTREFLQRRYPSRSGRQIACSNVQIDTPSTEVLQKRLARIEQHNRPVRLGLIGTLNARYKGIQTVFAALARVRYELPPLAFHILGAGDSEPWRKEARSYGVEDMVHFDTLRSPGAEVMAWLDEVDLYLQPSFQEGLPRATVEAMSRGCPVLGSTCAGIPELLPDDCCIKPGDDAHLARLIVRAVTDSQWRHQQAQANWSEAHEYAREILDARRDGMLSAFAEAVARTRRQVAI